VRSGSQAEAWVRWWIDERGLLASDFMVSEFLPGREFAYQSVWQDGELVAGQARERLEYLYGHLTPSGQTSTPAVARTVDEPAVDALAMRAIRALDAEPRGAYCVDVKEAADGMAKVTEINAGRFFTTSNFFAAAGLNMPEMLVSCALGERPSRRGSSPLPSDLFWIRMVDMGYVLVPGDELDAWPSPHR
jgi:carbamoyl-phosphate synthase large subunit